MKRLQFVRVSFVAKFGDFLVVMVLLQSIVCGRCTRASVIADNRTSNVSWITQELVVPAGRHEEQVASAEDDENDDEGLLFLQFLNVIADLYERVREREQMQRDEPQRASGSENVANATKARELRNGTNSNTAHIDEMKNRAKESQLAYITQRILTLPGRPASQVPPQLTNKSILDIVQSLPPLAATNYVTSTQDVLPSCGLPKHIDKEEWQRSQNINLYFDPVYPKSEASMAIRISAAKLRLYKLPIKMSETSNDNIDISLAAPEIQEAIKKSDIPDNVANAILTDSVNEEKKIKVSVYYYTRPLKKTKEVKRKPLDTKMLYAASAEITLWDLKKATQVWKNESKNFGITIAVEDERGKSLPAHQFFNVINCSKPIEFPTAIPKIVLEGQFNDSNTRNQTPNENLKKYYKEIMRIPALEITTEEVPINDVILNATKKSAVQRGASLILSNGQSKGSLVQILYNNTQTSHKRRHNAHKKNNENDKSNQSRNASKESSEE